MLHAAWMSREPWALSIRIKNENQILGTNAAVAVGFTMLLPGLGSGTSLTGWSSAASHVIKVLANMAPPRPQIHRAAKTAGCG